MEHVTALNYGRGIQGLAHKLAELKSRADSREESLSNLRAAVMEHVEQMLSDEEVIERWIHTCHGFNVCDERAFEGVPPLKPGWKVARYIRKADYGDGWENPVIEIRYIALPEGSTVFWPDHKEVSVDEYKSISVEYYAEDMPIRLPEQSFVWDGGEWTPITGIDR